MELLKNVSIKVQIALMLANKYLEKDETLQSAADYYHMSKTQVWRYLRGPINEKFPYYERSVSVCRKAQENKLKGRFY